MILHNRAFRSILVHLCGSEQEKLFWVSPEIFQQIDDFVRVCNWTVLVASELIYQRVQSATVYFGCSFGLGFCHYQCSWLKKSLLWLFIHRLKIEHFEETTGASEEFSLGSEVGVLNNPNELALLYLLEGSFEDIGNSNHLGVSSGVAIPGKINQVVVSSIDKIRNGCDWDKSTCCFSSISAGDSWCIADINVFL